MRQKLYQAKCKRYAAHKFSHFLQFAGGWFRHDSSLRPVPANCKRSLFYVQRNFQTLPGSRRSEEHTSELQSRQELVCRLLLEKRRLRIDQRDDGIREGSALCALCSSGAG